jgi:hypothetical protein
MKTGGKIMTAGQFRDHKDIEKLIQQHNGYQILEQLRCPPSSTGNQQNGSHGYYSEARSCNTNCDLVGGSNKMTTFTQTIGTY